MRTEIVGDEVDIRGACGVGRLRVREELVLDNPNVGLVSAGSLVAGSLEVTGNEVVKGNLTVEGASGVSVDEDVTVGGATSTGSLMVNNYPFFAHKYQYYHSYKTGQSDKRNVNWGVMVNEIGASLITGYDDISIKFNETGKYLLKGTVEVALDVPLASNYVMQGDMVIDNSDLFIVGTQQIIGNPRFAGYASEERYANVTPVLIPIHVLINCSAVSNHGLKLRTNVIGGGGVISGGYLPTNATVAHLEVIKYEEI